MARKKATSRRAITILDGNKKEEKQKKIPASQQQSQHAIIVPGIQLSDTLIPRKETKTVATKTLKKSKSKKKEDDDYISELANFTDYVESSSYCGGVAFRNGNFNGVSDSSSDDNSDSDFNADDDDHDDEEEEGEEEEIEETARQNRKDTDLTNSETGLVLLETPNNTDNPGSNNNTTNAITVYCPHPAPKTVVKKTKFSNSLQGPQEVSKMVQLLRTRTTLCPLTEHDHIDADKNEMQVLDGTLSMIKTGNQSQNWSNTLLKTVQQEPHKLIAENLSQFLEDSLVKQAEKEFLYWSFLPDEERNNSSRYPYWKSILQKLAETHPSWRNYSKDQVKIMIRSGGISALKTVTQLSENANKLVEESLTWISSLEEGMKKTLLFMKKFRILEAEIESKHKNLDEYCHWGKKYLQEMFSPPYFTLSSSDYCHLVDQSHFLENYFDDAIIDVCKQKWTNKDFRSLQKFIKDVIIDAEYAKYVDRYNYLASRIIFERVQRLQEEEERNQAAQEPMPSSSSYQRAENFDQFGQFSKKGTSRRKKQKVADCEHAKTTLQRHFKVNLDDDSSSSPSSTVEINANITVKAQDLQKWFHGNESRLRKLTYEVLMKEPQYFEEIDWYKVAKKVSIDSGKDRSANDCFLAWKHEAHPSVNTRRWSGVEIKQLIDTVQLKIQNEGAIDWKEIAFIAGNNRTPYQCFFKYRNRVVQNEIMTWNEDKTQNVCDIIINEGAKWRNAVEGTGDGRATKHQVQDRWKKTCNPILRHGPFTRVEDALLLLQIEKLQEFLKKEHNFGILISYLPWRYETVWRDRANHLFSNWIVPWTKEEDELLLKLAEEQCNKKNWQEIAGKFSSFKNRKGCLTRHKILKRKIGEGKKFKDLDEYHEAYSMFRKNVFQYKHLKESVELLKRVIGEELCEEPFPGLSSTSSPEEWELRYMLLDYDRSIMQKTIEHLEIYITSRNEYWKDWIDTNKILKTFDRRTFHPENPQSVASAVHMRGLKLKSKSEIGRNLTEFEEDVYKYYGRFCRTKPVNKEAERKYLPSAKKLMKLSEIKEIVELSSDMDEELSSDDDDKEPPPKRKRGQVLEPSLPVKIVVRKRGRSAKNSSLITPPPKSTQINEEIANVPPRRSLRMWMKNNVDTKVISLPLKSNKKVLPLKAEQQQPEIEHSALQPKKRTRSSSKTAVTTTATIVNMVPPTVIDNETSNEVKLEPSRKRLRCSTKSIHTLVPVADTTTKNSSASVNKAIELQSLCLESVSSFHPENTLSSSKQSRKKSCKVPVKTRPVRQVRKVNKSNNCS